ncbi:hypothetical protein Glove_13g231 [Diversispora epigaea]|uniref:TLDc domain-containing protein n=1 Tax=Diversispora epigaea TaxID=1348612 RepID=A0A397JRW0_9GLOM|nr:hypothetical protein Glove_13g231 [Diversispora epigaea]
MAQGRFSYILDKQLCKDIIQHLAAPDRPIHRDYELPPHAEEPKEPFSTIITEEHATEISNWIDKTTVYSITNIQCTFELILSGTRDGFAPQTFWYICHVHAKTVVVIKVKGTLEGYNPLA